MTTHDPEALWAARHAVRECYLAIRQLPQADPTIRDLLNRIDEIAVELTIEIEAMEPRLPLVVVALDR